MISLKSSWDIITAASTNAHPIYSFACIRSDRTIAENSAPKTDSRERIILATAGSESFCPIIWQVYAIPLEPIPRNRSSGSEAEIAERSTGGSNIRAKIRDSTVTVAN